MATRHGSWECDQKHRDEVDKILRQSLSWIWARWLSRRLAERGRTLEGWDWGQRPAGTKLALCPVQVGVRFSVLDSSRSI